MLKAALFDLDGTLLPVDTQKFMQHYLSAIGTAAAPVMDPKHFTQCLVASTEVMLNNREQSLTNSKVFWADFRARVNNYVKELEPLIQAFYDYEFGKLRRVAARSIHARQAVQTALDLGLRIVVATNPVFPRQAICERMAWAGVDDMPWELVTSYEKMHFCKPHIEYYREITSLLDIEPDACLMIGNDEREDLIAAELGMKTCLVTDHLISRPEQEKFEPHWRGPLSKLAGWLSLQNTGPR